MFSLPDIAEVVFQGHKQRISSLLSNRWSPWQRQLAEYGCEAGQMLQSTPYVTASHDPDPAEMADRPLHFRSISPCAGLVLFVHWAFSNRRGGGVGIEGAQSSAKSLLCRFLSFMQGDASVVIKLCTRGDISRLGCGILAGDKPISVPISVEGVLNLTEMRAKACDGDYSVSWLDAIGEHFQGEPVTLVAFLEWLSADAPRTIRYQLLRRQVMWGLGGILDDKLKDAEREHAAATVGRERAAATVVIEADTAMTQSQRTGAYYYACRDFVQKDGLQFLSSASDKARVQQWGLGNMLMVVPSNDAFWTVPQDYLFVNLFCVFRSFLRLL